jgi:hypothetical protein
MHCMWFCQLVSKINDNTLMAGSCLYFQQDPQSRVRLGQPLAAGGETVAPSLIKRNYSPHCWPLHAG